MASVAADLDVSRETVYAWMKKYPDFSYSIKRGKAKGQKYFEQIMMSKVTGQKLKNKKGIEFDPKKSDSTVLIFAMKTRFHEDYGNKDKVEVAHNEIKITISEDDQDL